MLRRCILLLLTWLPISSLAQVCPQAPVLSKSLGENFFTEEQEVVLGDLLAKRINYSLRVIEDRKVAGYVGQIGARLLANMPPTRLKFRFYVIDAPVANAFAIAGGSVYVTRKLIATVHSEDELAGVIAHELGHQLAHHSAIQFTRVFQRLLRVTQLRDAADVEVRYDELLDKYRLKPGAFRDENGEDEQLGADQVAVYAMGRAGYSPQAMVDWWDRFAETEGKKGSWLTDWLGTTRPQNRRLREFVKNAAAIPASCIQTASPTASADFKSWQHSVELYRDFGKIEDVKHVIVKRKLEPALRGDVRHFAFSPDGKYLLAQDEANIFVLSRAPLANLFRIRARDAKNAHFTPDSKQVVFSTVGLTVERWNIAEQRLESNYELHVLDGCLDLVLSPSGNYLACLKIGMWPLELVLLDVTTGDTVVSKKDFLSIWDARDVFLFPTLLKTGNAHFVFMEFSPDEHYFIASRSASRALFDVKEKKDVPMLTTLLRYAGGGFTFIAPDRILGLDTDNTLRSAVVEVPSGKVLVADVPTGGRTVQAVSKGDYVLVRPMLNAPVGVLNLKDKKIFMANKLNAIDFFEETFVAERVNGEIALYSAAGQKPLSTIALPASSLGNPAALAVSPDLSWLAVSGRTRGAIWNLSKGDREIYVRGFRNAAFEGDRAFIDFAPEEQTTSLPKANESAKAFRDREFAKPGNALAQADLVSHSFTTMLAIQRRKNIRQYGTVAVVWSAETDDDPWKNQTMEAFDVHTGSVLWTRKFEYGDWSIHGTGNEFIVLMWHLGSEGARKLLKQDNEAKKLVNAMNEKDGGYLIEIIDPHTGKDVAKTAVTTNRSSFRARKVRAVGSTLLIVDENERVLIYDFAGRRKGKLFGGDAILSVSGGKIVVEQEPGRIATYDTSTLAQQQQFTFGSEVVSAAFSGDDRRLFVLTEDQTAYVFDLDSKVGPTAVSTK